MKRELKLEPIPPLAVAQVLHCRAYPDEKGIETTRPRDAIVISDVILQSLSR